MDEQKAPVPPQGESAATPAPAPSSPPPTTASATESSLIAPGDWISQSWEVYKKLWKRLLLLVLLNYLAMIPLGIIAVIFVILGVLNAKGLFSPTMIVSIVIAVIIAFVYVSITSSLISIMMILTIKKRDEAVGIKALLQEAWSKLWAYWYVSFLVGFLIMGGLFLFIIPWIIFAVWFSFATFVFLFEGKKGMDALIVSREYVRGRWLGIFGRGILIGLLMLLVTYVPTIVFMLLKLKTFGSVIQSIISVVVSPFPTIAAVLLYESARKGREVSTVAAKKEKVIYSAVAVLGLIVFFALFVLIAVTASNFLNNMSKTKPTYPPTQYSNPYTLPVNTTPAASI